MLDQTDPAILQQMMQQPAQAGVSLPPTGNAIGGGQGMPNISALMGSTNMMPPMAPPANVKMYDVKIKRCIKSGEVKVKILPPEDFLCDPTAMFLDEDEGRFFGDVSYPTRAELKARYPKKKKIIDDLPAYTESSSDGGAEKSARQRQQWTMREPNTDKATERVETFELYVKVDYDDDGVAEWRQVVMAGNIGEREILSNEEWGGNVPYSDIVPNPMPHRRRGRSIYDDVGHVQRIKTVLLRQMLDNLYLANHPTRAANAMAIENKDELINPSIGGVVWTKGDPNAIIKDYAIPFVAQEVFPVLEYFDMVIEKRTGVSRSTMAMDLDALQNQTATAVNAAQSAAYSKVETYARNIAECGGLKRLFKCLLKLFVENQKSVKQIRLRSDWVPMDPRGWNADMDCHINVGLGSGSRDRDLGVLQAIAQKQELVIQTLGPENPICGISEVSKTYQKMTESAGVKNPDEFFKAVSDDDAKAFAAKQAQQPHPEQAKAQMQMQIEQAKLQANMQLEQARMQADAQRDAQKAAVDQQQMAQKAEIEKIQAQADIATQDRKTQAEIMMAERKFELEATLKREEHAMRMQEMQINSAQKEREFSMRENEAYNASDRAREEHGLKMESAGKGERKQSEDNNTQLLQAIHESLNKPKKRKVIRDKEGRISHVEEE